MIARARTLRIGLLSLTLLKCLTLTGCGDDDGGEGTVAVEIWGEDFIEVGVPAAELADGWAITFESFVVTVGDITAAGVSLPGTHAIDVTVPGPTSLATAPAPAGAIAPVGYALVPADGGTTNVNVDPSLFDTLVAQGWSVYVAGRATRDGSSLTFAWGFDVAVAYTECEATDRISSGATGTTQLTIHGDHLLYDSLVDADAALRFTALADADTDGNSDITPSELAAVSGIDFQALDHYDVGAGSAVDNLWEYLSAQVATLGHIDGEGHCHF